MTPTQSYIEKRLAETEKLTSATVSRGLLEYELRHILRLLQEELRYE